MAVRTYIEGGNKEMARNNDPHKNTWGGKNNTWGNKGRAPRNNTPQNQYDGGLSKFGAVVLGGCCIIAVLHGGVKPLLDKLNGISDAKENIELTRDILNSSPSGTGEAVIDKLGEKVLDNIEIDGDTIRDVVEYLGDYCREIETDSIDLVKMDYSALDNVETYQKYIVEDVRNHQKPVVYILSNNEVLSEEDMNTEYSRLTDLVVNHTGSTNSIYRNVGLRGWKGLPENDNLTVTITFTSNKGE